jgi:hypothetical protein
MDVLVVEFDQKEHQGDVDQHAHPFEDLKDDRHAPSCREETPNTKELGCPYRSGLLHHTNRLVVVQLDLAFTLGTCREVISESVLEAR